MAPIQTLRSGLVSYWPLWESTGTRYDVAGSGNSLTASASSPTQAAGIQVYAGSFAAASSQSLSVADNALVSTGDVDYTICCWVNATTLAADRSIVSKYGPVGQRELYLWYNNASGRLSFAVSGNGTATTVVADTSLGAPSTGTWYFVRAWHDATGNTINIQTNQLAAISAAHTTGSFDSTTALMIGAVVPSAPLSFWNGAVCEVGFWKRLLTTQEHEWLYNFGKGRTYPFENSISPMMLGRAPGMMARRNRMTGVIG